MSKIGIVGLGYVGRAVWAVLQDHYTPAEIVTHDKNDATSLTFGEEQKFCGERWALMRDEMNACDIVFICVPTPTGDNGEVDTSAVEEVLEWLEVPLVVIRSTMPPAWPGDWINSADGTPGWDTRMAQWRSLAYQPEFIGESPFAPWREESDVSLVVAGGEKAQEVLDFWKPILGPRVRYIATDWRTAAEIKMAINTHAAVKGAWWREFLSHCAQPDVVRNAVVDHIPWISSYHTLPIGDAIGGHCIPKDFRAWATAHPSPIAKAVLGYLEGVETCG